MKVLIPFLAAFALSLGFGLVLAKIAPRIGLMDTPDRPRKIHPRPVPLVGGLAIWLAVMVTAGFNSNQFAVRYSGILFLPALIGLLDDWFELTPLQKFGLQLLSVFGFLALLFWIAIGRFPINDVVTPNLGSLLCFLFSGVWIVLMMNAVNYTDNINGLCAGMSLIILCGSWATGGTWLEWFPPLAGAILGFLVLNFPGGRIFLGDCGSQLLGFLVGFQSLMSWQHAGSPRFATYFIYDRDVPVMVLLVGLPLIDFIQVTIGRLRRGQPIWQGDANHLSHLLVRRGFTPVHAVIILWVVTAVLTGMAVLWWRYEPIVHPLTVPFGPFE